MASSRNDPPTPETGIARVVPRYLVPAVLLVLVSAVYWQVGGHAFVNLDDGLYVSGNPVVLRGLTRDGFSWAFTTFHAANWHPLTWLSHMLDVELFGPSPGWHHRVNALYHLLNTELLFLVLWRMTGGLWPSAFVAALFGVHPLHVESVAWVSERKDVLSTLFWILTMGAYLRYTRCPGVARYLPVAVFFALGLMCKPMLVTLPFVLLLMDWWPLGRMARAVHPDSRSWLISVPALFRLAREKTPLLALAAISCVVTFLAQAEVGAMRPNEIIPLGSRISNACVSYVTYLGNMVWPSSLAALYPHPALVRAGVPAWEVAGAILLLCGLSALALAQSPRRPYLAVGWLWYLGTLVPVIGLVQAGGQAMADRYTYVPLIGIFIAVAWGIPAVATGRRLRRLAFAASAGAVAALSAAAWVQAGYWRDSVSLYSRTLAVTERNSLAWYNLGVAFDQLGRVDQAISSYREALRITPDDVHAWNNLGAAYRRLGRNDQAISSYREALRITPDYADAWNNLGLIYGDLGRVDQAVSYYREALRIRPDHANAWYNLGLLYGNRGEYRSAIDYYREALRIRPDFAEAWYNLGVLHGKLGRHRQAIDCNREALRIDRNYAEAWNNLGVGFMQLGRFEEAAGYFGEALRIKPDYAEARNNLIAASAGIGRRR